MTPNNLILRTELLQNAAQRSQAAAVQAANAAEFGTIEEMEDAARELRSAGSDYGGWLEGCLDSIEQEDGP